MIADIADLPAGVIGVEVLGRFDVADFTDSVAPLVAQVEAAGSEIRLVVHLGPRFRGFGEGPWGALTNELVKIPFHRGALVTDDVGLSTGFNLLKWTLAGQARTFRNDEFDSAVDWAAG